MKIGNLYFLVLFQLFSQIITSQTIHNVNVSSFSFTPAQITINVGDIVRWTNSGGLHNVVADDNSFTSGAVSSSAWVYEHTFNSVGTNPYYCSLHGGPGGVGMSGVVTVENATDVSDDNVSIFNFELNQNYPNPFNPTTTLTFTIPVEQLVTLKVYNSIGEEVRTLINDNLSKGTHKINFNADGLSSGLYLYRLESRDQVKVRKMILIK